MSRKTRKKLMSALCIAAAAVMCVSVTGCAGKNNNGGGTSQEESGNGGKGGGNSQAGANDTLIKINYKVSDIKMPADVNYINDFFWDGENIVVTQSTYDYNEETGVSTQNCKLVTYDMQGKEVSSVDLGPVKDNEQDNAYISISSFLDDGTAWLTESHNSYDPETYETLSQRTIVKHISLSGEELYSKDITEIGDVGERLKQDNTYFQNFYVDGQGRMMVIISSYNDSQKTTLICLDENGEFVFEKEYTDEDGWFNDSFVGGDGDIYVIMYLRDKETGYMNMACMKADFEGKKFSDPISFPDRAYNLIKGNDDYLAFYTDSTSLYGITYDGESEEYFNCVTNGLDLDYVNSISIHGDDMLIPDSYSDEGVTINYVQKLDESEVKEKIEVKMAAYYLDDSIRSAAARYNKSDGDYIITIVDYSRFNDYSSDNEEDYKAGLTKLNAEIAAGDIPDIFCINDEETMGSLSSKSLFVDLNTYIDGEDGINRDDYFDHIFRATETNGKLYSISDSFYVSAFMAKKKYFPEDGAITWEQVDSILAENQGMRLLPQTTIRDTFMNYAIAFNMDNFIDSESGECSFNTPEFINILEKSKDYPEEFDYSSLEDNYWEEAQMAYVKDEVLLANRYISGYNDLNAEIAQYFGGDMEVSTVGFPGTDKCGIIALGSAAAISAKSAHPEAGWQLIKSYLEYDENSDYDYWRFSVNKKKNKAKAERTLKNNYYTDDEGNEVLAENSYYINGVEVKIPPTQQSDIDKMDQFILSIDNVYTFSNESIFDIINEEAADFYEGKATAEQAAAGIQSRVSIYISEHN